MDIVKSRLAEQQISDNSVHIPQFYRLTNLNDRKNLETLLNNSSDIVIHDEIQGQLKELLKSLNPKTRIKPEEYPEYINKHLNGCPIEDYGVWVYYPWSKKLIHILDKEEFIYLRTAANRHKITTEERDILAEKTVGVIGLSVGQSVSVTLAMERSCGELRLADFDTLELNNLNRIRTGLQNLGLKKVISVAREIAEIDPFFKVVLYPEGITEENIHGFFTDNGKLDLVIDECDGVDVKILCRLKARELDVPVLMEASDRGTVDVERFDLEPDRKIMHGWLEHLELDFDVLKNLKTSEEKLPYILPISGLETISPRMKASMMEIEQSITTWPQLASAVTLGGAITTDVCRRIFLDQYHESGRYFIDIEKLIGDKEVEDTKSHQPVFQEGISVDRMEEIARTAEVPVAGDHEHLNEETISELVDAAVQAPTGGNSQPWKWYHLNGMLYLFKNIEYHTALVDYHESASAIGLGAATENLIQKAHSLGYDVRVDKVDLQPGSELAAIIRFYKKDAGDNSEAHSKENYAAAIPDRFSNRIIAEKQPIDAKELTYLQEVASSINGAHLQFITDEGKIQTVAEVMGRSDRLRLMHEGGHKDFLAEIVWPEEVDGPITKGLDIDTLDITASERVGFKIAKEWKVIDYLNKWDKGTGLERVTYNSAMAASAIGLITMPKFDMNDFFDGGRALERVWLAATARGISFQPISISTFLFNRMLHEGAKNFPERILNDLKESRKKFESVFDIGEGRGEVFMFKLFYTDKKIKRSLRAPVKEVLVYKS